MQRAKYGTNTEAEAEDILGLRPEARQDDDQEWTTTCGGLEGSHSHRFP